MKGGPWMQVQAAETPKAKWSHGHHWRVWSKERAVSVPSKDLGLEGTIPGSSRSAWPQVELEEAVVRRRAAEQTLGQRIKVWSVRALLNLLILALLGAAFYGIYWATEYTVTLQVQRVLEEEGSRVLELTFPRVKPCVRELRSRISGILDGLGNKGLGF